MKLLFRELRLTRSPESGRDLAYPQKTCDQQGALLVVVGLSIRYVWGPYALEYELELDGKQEA